ncbi:MAG: hypothetical protein WD271_11225 [Acidimicrobiia bacterium]
MTSSSEKKQCPIYGETKMPGWDVCPACGHPYDDKNNDLRTAMRGGLSATSRP